MEANGREEEKGVGSRGGGGGGESCPRLLQAHQLSLFSPFALRALTAKSENEEGGKG